MTVRFGEDRLLEPLEEDSPVIRVLSWRDHPRTFDGQSLDEHSDTLVVLVGALRWAREDSMHIVATPAASIPLHQRMCSTPP